MGESLGSSVPPVESVIIVGGGLAGLSTAQELRQRDFTGSITIIDREGLPYDRPPLSKAYLQAEASEESLLLVEEAWFEKHNVEVVIGQVQQLDAATGTVSLDDARSISADRIVLATGSIPRPLGVPGSDHSDIMYLRTRFDADRIRPYLGKGNRLLIVGAGLIGAELASTAVSQGSDVVLVDPTEIPLAAAVGEELATRLHAMHTEADVTCVLGAVKNLDRTNTGWVATIDRGAGNTPQTVECNAVVVAIGVLPDTSIAQASGLDVNGGVLVNDFQQTSSSRVFAVGDMARHRRADGTLDRIHEHWESAATDGRRAAAAILGQDPASVGAPWFWSDRYDVHVEVVGSMTGPGETAIRDSSDGSWAAFRVHDDMLVGCAGIDATKLVRAARRIIDKRVPVTAKELVTASDLRRLAR